MEFIEWVQRRLMAHGFNPGLIDGVWGRNTLKATVAFQRSRDLPANGTLNAATIAALRAAPLASGPPVDAPPRDLLDRFPWMILGLSKRGLIEDADNIELRAFLKSDGKTLGDPAQLPWCGDFVETCVALSLPDAVLPSNPYAARNWLNFGQPVDPCFGSVLIFWRGSRNGWKGHVGFYYSEDDDHYQVLGGNQSNSISVASLAKNRFLGARLPDVGGPYPRQVVRSKDDWEISEDEF